MLRDYQLDATARVRQAMVSLHAAGRPMRVCLVVPTGGGKTVMGADIARRTVERGRKVLWGVHRSELVDQAYDALVAQGLRCGVICAGSERPVQPYAPVQVATFQTLGARGVRPDADLVVFDEAHHAAAKTFAGIIKHYEGVPVLGLTATPERGDGKPLGDMFEEIVTGATVKQLVAAGHLVPADIIRPKRKLRSGEIAQRPVDAWMQHARGLRTIVFSPSVALAEQHAEEFSRLGFSAAMVEGETDRGERREIWRGFRSGVIQVVTNVYVATEGFDLPAIEVVILARGCGHAGTYLQMVGRALRPSPGKSRAMIIDLQGISHDHGHPEDERIYSLVGARGISEAAAAEPRVVQAYCKVCSEPLDADDSVCPVCGTERAAQWKITGEALIPYAAKRREGVDQRVATLARWIKEGRSKGFKPGWARVKFMKVYGEPTGAYEAAAHALLRGEEQPQVVAEPEHGGWV